MKIGNHIIFWLISGSFLSLFYGYRNDSISLTIWFVAALLPISIFTTYFFNYRLIPRFLLKEKFNKFLLYSIYTLIISAYLEFIILVLLFVFLANLKIDIANFDSLFLLVGMYVPVLIGVAAKLFRSWKSEEMRRSNLETEKEDLLGPFRQSGKKLKFRADRKIHQINPSEIIYIEGLKDYVKVHLQKAKPLIVKETLSSMDDMLKPFGFLRVHKSFIVSILKVKSFSTTEVIVEEFSIPIGRSFRDSFLNNLKEQ